MATRLFPSGFYFEFLKERRLNKTMGEIWVHWHLTNKSLKFQFWTRYTIVWCQMVLRTVGFDAKRYFISICNLENQVLSFSFFHYKPNALNLTCMEITSPYTELHSVWFCSIQSFIQFTRYCRNLNDTDHNSNESVPLQFSTKLHQKNFPRIKMCCAASSQRSLSVADGDTWPGFGKVPDWRASTGDHLCPEVASGTDNWFAGSDYAGK